MIIKTLENELFWGGRVDDGWRMPFEAGFEADLGDQKGNQLCYLLMSSKGRVIWSDEPFAFKVEEGSLSVTGRSAVFAGFAGKTLKDAVIFAQNKIYPKRGALPPKPFFDAPQFNTWIELIYDQNQADIIRYAEAIAENGYPRGVLMIDDNWQETYGVWKFHEGRFPNPKAMMDRLHELGFKVMLWVVPFVSADTLTFRNLKRKNPAIFVRNQKGKTAMIEWWNGYSAVLDLSNPDAIDWFKGELTRLQEEYGVDGFKFDAGGAHFYKDDLVYTDPACKDFRQTQAFCAIAEQYPYNELRESANQPYLSAAERLRDKRPTWTENGLDTLIPNSLAQSLVGYQYICPDMIGGGEYSHFMYGGLKVDQELFVRAAQCSALLPMMQFSAGPWRVLSEDKAKLCLEAAKLHEKFAPYIIKTLEECRESGEPVLRLLEYVWPNRGYEKIRNEYMLGGKYLVAPVLEPGIEEMDVVLPEGCWKADDGMIYEGSRTVTVKTPLERLPYFELL